MKTKTQAIKEFLATQKCKLDLYTEHMEVQVNVLPGPHSDKKRGSIVWSDDDNSWAAFRIPYGGAGIDAEPTYSDTVLPWPLDRYAEGIGCTGWDWFNRVSRYIGFDFDSIVNHQRGLSDSDLDKLRVRVKNVPYITLRRSKSGKGYHLYIEFDKPIPTQNHTEHAALAKAVLSNLSALLGFNFEDKVDTCGGVLWIWHRDADPSIGSFTTIKAATENLRSVPSNWRDFIPTRRSRGSQKFEDLVSKTRREALDEDHRTLITWLMENQKHAWWDAERHMLITHTKVLKDAHIALGLRGVFETIATGKDEFDHNCFAFPESNGAWRVIRYSPGTKEHEYWTTTTNGWVAASLNKLPDLHTAAKMYQGTRTAKGTYIFENTTKAFRALSILGTNLTVEKEFRDRETVLRPGKSEAEIVVSFKYEDNDPSLAEWYIDGRPRRWERVVLTEVEVKKIEPPDEEIRHVNMLGSKGTWFVQSRGRWVEKNKDDVKSAMLAMDYSKPEIERRLGMAVLEAWDQVVIPFGDEYPGNRSWNRGAPQYSVTPSTGKHPSWDRILNHIGEGLDVSSSEWCREHNVSSGSQYLMCWIASMFRHPFEPLPYLFLFSPEENTGKSILHEGLQLLFRDAIGYAKADQCLTNTSGFNGELHGAVLAVVEEVDLSSHKVALERIKDWVTGKQIYIRHLHRNGFITANTTHWIQCANDESYCPIFPGDTRITAVRVPPLTDEIPKPELLSNLLNEAGYFLHTIQRVFLPPSPSRLRVPVIDSDIKYEIQERNRNRLHEFVEACCKVKQGFITDANFLMQEFYAWLNDDTERLQWPRKRILKEFPSGLYLRGDYTNVLHFGNMFINDKVSRQIGQEVVKDGRKLKAG